MDVQNATWGGGMCKASRVVVVRAVRRRHHRRLVPHTCRVVRGIGMVCKSLLIWPVRGPWPGQLSIFSEPLLASTANEVQRSTSPERVAKAMKFSSKKHLS